MPREARKKDENSIYHIMVRSISELQLFKEDEDKIKYFALIIYCGFYLHLWSNMLN